MKKIKTACVDKLLALSSCFVITNCDKSAEDKKDGEKYGGFNRLNSFVNISSSARGKNIPEFADKTLKGVIDKVLPGLFDNSRIPIQFRQLGPGDVINCLKNINDSLGSDRNHEDIYSVLIYYNAYIRSFGIFGLRDEALIDFIGDLINALGKVCNELKNKKNLKRDNIAWFPPNSNKTTIPYGDIKKFFNDICIAFLCSKDVADLTYPSEHFFSKTELDTEKAGFLICCDQIESHTSEILKKVNDDMNAWEHSKSPDEAKYAGNTSNGTFGGVKHVKTISKKNEILATIRDPNNTCFTCKNLDNKTDLTHNNPLSINTKDHVNSIVAGLKDIEAVLTCYADKKKEIDRDKEDLKENFKKIDLDIERLLTALIYRGIQYNQFFVSSGTLQSLFHFTTQEKPLDSLNNALQGITEYTGNILSGILGKIFEAANKIKQVTDPHQGVVSIDLTALQKQIDDFNQKILNDRILFELAYNARRYLTDLFTGTNAAFITKVPNKITEILTNHNTENYGNFLKGVCYFLSTWDYKNNKDDSGALGDGTKWACKFNKLEYNKYNNPFIFDNGTEAAGFDFAFNDVQNILYEKYADCVLPETFLECQQLFKRTRDICLTDKGGLFNKIANLHDDDTFQNNTSLRSLDLLKICLPTNGENKNTFFNFFKRLPNTKNGENGEYIDGAEKWTIGKENDDKKKIIGYINVIPELVNERKDVNNPCPKIDNAIGKLTNFILIDNPNEVIDICNSKGYKQDFTKWEKSYSLNNNVKALKICLKNVYGVRGKDYQAADSNITLNFTFHDPKDMVAQCHEQNFGKTVAAFPALFAEENKFAVENYTSFHDNFFHIEEHLYYVLCCIKTLGASIPRRFLKNDDEKQNLLDSYRNCRNLSLLIENALTNVLIACAKPDNVKGWKMLGWNDKCTLHTENEENEENWGHYDIFIGPNGKEDYKESGNFSTQYSPFYLEINTRNSYAQTWEQSFLDYKSTVTKDILPISLEDLKCGFFNSFNKGTLIWNQTDFNNYICIGNPGNPGKQIYSTYPRALYYNENKKPYDNCTELQISLKKIIPNFQTSSIITECGLDPRDHCLHFNEEIAKKIDCISFSKVLDIYDSSNSCGWGKDDYLSLTYDNTRKKYSFTTFGNDTEKKFEIAKKHNFSALLNDVKECINNFYEFYNDKEVFTSLQQVNFTDAKSKALLKFYLKNNLKIVESNDYNSDFLNCFITPHDEDLNALKNCIIAIEKNENLVKSFADMTHRKQFYTEIYGETHEDPDTKKKIEHYNKVFKLFNLQELQCGSVFEKNNYIFLNEKSEVSYSNFDQRLKEKVEDFFVKVHEEWCKQVMSYTTGDADKSLLNILDGLGKKTYTTLDSNVINDFKTLKANIDKIKNWFAIYNGNSLQNLQDCVGKIDKDDTTDDSALKELTTLLGTIKPGDTTENKQIDPTKVKDKLNDVFTSLDDVIKNLPNEDADDLKSIFVLKPNEGTDEIAKYQDCKAKLKENKKELDKYKTWLRDYGIDIFTELKNCLDSLNDNLTTLNDLNDNITEGTFPNNLKDLKTLLGKQETQGSIKASCNTLIDNLKNLNTEDVSKKVFFGGKQDLSNYIQTLDKALNNLPEEDPKLENDLYSINEYSVFASFEPELTQQIKDRFKKKFDNVYKDITSPIQSLQDCIGDIDKILKAHLKDELEKVKTLLGKTKTTLNDLDALTKTDNIYMETMKYICDNQDNVNTSIGKLLAGVHEADDNGTLQKVVNWKRGDIPKTQFYRSLDDIANGLNNMLKAGGGNDFETAKIKISAADTGLIYGDRVTVSNSTIITNDNLTEMAKENLFNETVLNTCLKG